MNLDTLAVGNVAWQAGFRGDQFVTAVAVSRTENTQGDPALNSPPNADPWGSIDRGLWQINSHWHPEVTDAVAHDPLGSAQAAYRISGGGRDFSAWKTFTSGAYRAHLAEAQAVLDQISGAAGPTGGTGATPPDPNAGAGTLSPDITPATVGAPLANEWQSPHPVDSLLLGGGAISANIAPMVSDTSQMAFSIDQVSEMHLIVQAPSLFVLGSGLIMLGVAAQWQDVPLLIAAIEVRQGPAAEEIDVTLRSAGAESLHRNKGPNPPAPPWSNLSPTELMQQLAQAQGLRFVGKGSPRVAGITRNTTSAAPDLWESDWDLGKRHATELGFWAFEASGTYYFGPPSWLVNLLPTFQVGWRGSAGDPALDSMSAPTCRRSIDTKVTGAEITVTLPRNRGEQIRCGMTMNFSGVFGFEGPYIVATVSWPLDGGVGDVTVTCREPIDPQPTVAPATSSVSPGPGSMGGSATGTASALDFVSFALRQVGKPYIFGGNFNDPHAPNPAAFDCASLVQWCAAQVGVDPANLGYNVTLQYAACLRARSLLGGLDAGGNPIDPVAAVRQGLKTRGALMFVGQIGAWEHVAISLGDGHSTVQATHTGSFVMVVSQESDFTASGLVPGMSYGNNVPTGTGWRAA